MHSHVTTTGSWLLRALLPIAILAGGVYGFRQLSIEPSTVTLPPAPPVAIRTQVMKLTKGSYPVRLISQGILQAHNQVSLTPQVTGKIVQFGKMFEVGSFFSRGDLLLEIEAADYVTALKIAEARLKGCEANVDLATKNLNRSNIVSLQNAITASEIDELQATLELRISERDSARAERDKAARDLDRTKILAPFDGRVLARSVGIGDTVSNNSALGILIATDFAEVRLPLSANDLKFVKLPEHLNDPPVEVEIRDALETQSAVRKAQILRTEGALNQDSLELFVIARIDDPFGLKSKQEPLRIGQPVVATIVGQTLDDVFAIPRYAVRQIDQIILITDDLTIRSKRIVPVWSDENNLLVRDEELANPSRLSVTQLVYAPEGAKVEIIPDILDPKLSKTTIPGKSSPDKASQLDAIKSGPRDQTTANVAATQTADNINSAATEGETP